MNGEPKLGRAGARARESVLQLIEAGVFGPGSKLPGERELAERLGVSRSILRDALAQLSVEGYLENFPQRGWFVASSHLPQKVALRSFTEMARARGLTPGTRLLKSETRAATWEELEALALAPTAMVLEVHRLRLLNDVVACYDRSVIALDRAPNLSETDFANGSLYWALENVAGVRIVRTDYRMRAASATSDVAKALEIREGAPLLVGEETAYDLSGNPLMLGHVTYRHEAYEFRATLWRSYEDGADE